MNGFHYQAVYRKPHTPGEAYCPIDFFPRRKTLLPLVQHFDQQGLPCSPTDYHMISLPPGFPAPLGHVFLGIVPILDAYPTITGSTDERNYERGV